MSSQYVKLSKPEIVYSQKNLLRTQIEVLNILKSYKVYQRLRKKEFMLKIELKNKINEVKDNIILLEKILPKMLLNNMEKNKPISTAIMREEDLTLEQEVERIRQKLSRLKEG